MQTQSWPQAWLMTDERLGDALPLAIARAASAGAGVIVRHHASSPATRRDIAQEVMARGALLAVSRDVELAVELGAALVHNPAQAPGALPFSLSVHNDEQAREAARRKPSAVFISPLFASRSHPQSAPIGEEAGMRLARLAGFPAYALGGVTAELGAELIDRGWAGWAAIDAWIRT